ncbi:acyl carrier protein [Streptomyces avidinii]|uniref:acyl carrier protein n=1 Tax=Streptomyces avidinii TaxID=1895 RepID=UPI00386BB191|nr:acyl carrier protein [Streptomyces avidinii]
MNPTEPVPAPPVDLFGLVRETIADVLGTTPDVIVESTDLRAEYGIDSLEMMSIGAQLERALGMQISVEDLMRADTVGEAVTLLAERRAGRS